MRQVLPIRYCASLLVLLSCCELQGGGLMVLEYFPEPDGVRLINQDLVAGVIAPSANIDLTQTFTLSSSGSLSAIGFALGAPGGTPSLTASLYRVINGAIDPAPIASSVLGRDFFEQIGPQTVPLWIYAEFANAPPVASGEQLAFRIQSPLAEIWGPRSDVLAGGELVQIPGTDLAFRSYVVPEPSAAVLVIIAGLGCTVSRGRRSQSAIR